MLLLSFLSLLLLLPLQNLQQLSHSARGQRGNEEGKNVGWWLLFESQAVAELVYSSKKSLGDMKNFCGPDTLSGHRWACCAATSMQLLAVAEHRLHPMAKNQFGMLSGAPHSTFNTIRESLTIVGFCQQISSILNNDYVRYFRCKKERDLNSNIISSCSTHKKLRISKHNCEKNSHVWRRRQGEIWNSLISCVLCLKKGGKTSLKLILA